MIAASTSSWSRRLELGQRTVDDPGQDVRAEAAPDDRAGPRDRPGVVGQPLQPRQHGVADGVRHMRLADPPAVGPGIVVERRRAAPRCGGGCRSSARGRPRPRRAAPAARRRGSGSSRSPVSSSVSGRRRTSRAWRWLRIRDRHSRWMPSAGELVGAIPADEEERPLGRVPGELADHLEAHLVGPVEVLEDRASSAGRSPRGSGPRRRGRSAGARRARRRRARRRSRAGPPTGVPHWSSAAHAGGHLADRGERHLVVLRRHRAAVDAEPGRLRLAGRGPDQARLAKPGPARTGTPRCRGRDSRLGDQLIEELEKVVAADQDGAQNGPALLMARSLRRVRPGPRIGRMTDGFPRGRRPSARTSVDRAGAYRSSTR